MNPSLEFPEGWSKERSFAGKSFDELFTIEGIPLSWFYQRLFLPHVLPKPINTFRQMHQQEKLDLFHRAQLTIAVKLLAKYIGYQEGRKFNIINSLNSSKLNSAPKTFPSSPQKALFLSYFDHYQNSKVYRLQGIIDALAVEKIQSYLLFADKLSSRKRPPRHFNAINTIYQHVDKELIKQAREQASELHQRWKEIDQKVMEKVLTVDGHSLWHYFKYAFSLYLSTEFLSITILYYLVLSKIIAQENIAIVVTTAQNGLLERCGFAAAKNKKIPALFIQHGIGTVSRAAENFLENTTLAVFGPYHHKISISAGLSPERIKITGPVVYDEIAKYIHRKSGKSAGDTILIITQPLIEDGLIEKKEYFEKLRTVIKAALTLNLLIKIKLHPREIHFKEYEHLRALNPAKIKISRHQNSDQLYQLLNQAGVMINFRSSGTIIEAAILDIPTITIPFVKEMPGYLAGFDPSTTIPLAEDGVLLAQQIRDVMQHPKQHASKRRKMIREFFGKIDGKSSERAATLIMKLAEGMELTEGK